MDYTPVTFTMRENPRTTTYAHELALGVIVESGWLVMADRPEAYLKSPAKDILKQYESTWDETKFIDGYPGDFVCMARRKGAKWFIAGINAGQERTLRIPLDFIGNGTFNMDVCEDKPGEEMTNINIRKETVSNSDTFSIKMSSNGGFIAILNNVKQ
jgi:alpha-glucosidase